MDCIYCGPDKEPSREDVIPYALGGRYSSSNIICKECNSYFGIHVDRHITDWQLSLIARNCFDLAGHGGTVPRYEVERQDGQILTVERKGTLRPKWRDVVRRENGTGFFLAAGTPTKEDAFKAIDSIIARKTAEIGHPPCIVEKRVEVRLQRDWKSYESDIVYDYSKQGRAIAKMALHYLATQLERRFLLTRDFAPIMRFVRYGEHGNHPRLCQPAIPLEMESTDKPSIRHSLTLRCSRELRSAVCDVELFGSLRWMVVLSYSYEGPDLFRRLVVYPLAKTFEESELQDCTPLPAKLVLNVAHDELESRYDRLEYAVHSLVDWLNHRCFCQYTSEALPQAIAHASSEIPLSESGLDAWLAAVADRFSDVSSPVALKYFAGEASHLAADLLSGELAKLVGEEAGIGSEEGDTLEERFTRLIFIRLLVDALVLLIQRRRMESE